MPKVTNRRYFHTTFLVSFRYVINTNAELVPLFRHFSAMLLVLFLYVSDTKRSSHTKTAGYWY